MPLVVLPNIISLSLYFFPTVILVPSGPARVIPLSLRLVALLLTAAFLLLPVSADADFVICGEINTGVKPEGPFGDHLGYYSLTHDFPYINIHKVYAKNDAIWPFTVVGRPPQEDSQFGKLIHFITVSYTHLTLPTNREV